MDTVKLIIHSLVTSRLDYCNALLHGIPVTYIKKLQCVQNASARLITRTKKTDHISPVLFELHWLPIQQRIKFKLLMLTFKSLHGLAPSYLADLLAWYEPTRELRSANRQLLRVKPAKLSYGKRAFVTAAPELWNSLPTDIRQCHTVSSFKCKLKTYLFKEFYY